MKRRSAWYAYDEAGYCIGYGTCPKWAYLCEQAGHKVVRGFIVSLHPTCTGINCPH
ncbi:hypothetical protein [Actinomadura oligospora]|uniref:hypothetical protein n=1 Tax=Actinomadura oligospora TaxID=111804 RepID=UPI0004BBCB84|nr:hypothetical protein [Actinomadura oligospora]